MLNHEEAMKDQVPPQEISNRNSKNETPDHHYESQPYRSPQIAQTAPQGRNDGVITLSDQIVIPEFSAMALNDLSAPKFEGLGSLLPPSANSIGRKRFNSSMLDLKKMS